MFGLNVHNFHWHVFPMPISVSDTHGLFTLRDTQEPIAPDTEITERKIGFNAIFNANSRIFNGK